MSLEKTIWLVTILLAVFVLSSSYSKYEDHSMSIKIEQKFTTMRDGTIFYYVMYSVPNYNYSPGVKGIRFVQYETSSVGDIIPVQMSLSELDPDRYPTCWYEYVVWILLVGACIFSFVKWLRGL